MKLNATLLITITLLLLLWSSVGHAQSNNLRLETELKEQNYCFDAKGEMYRIFLTLTYTNLGSEPIILYKGSNLISYLDIAQNQKDLEKKKYEAGSMSITWVTSGSDFSEVGDIPDERFVVLKLGEHFETQSGMLSLKAPLTPGEHILRVIIPTWWD